MFELLGNLVGSLGWQQIGKLTPTFQGEPGEEGVPDTADPYGCGFLSDGRLVTTDIGNTASGPGTGQLIIWFPPLDAASPRFCKLDVAIGTAQGIFVDAADRVHVASARVEPGIWRYSPPFPTGPDAAGGCGRVDPTGAPLADAVAKEPFIPADENVPTPNGVAGSPDGTFVVSSIFNGVIAEYDASGRFLRRILQPPAGEMLGPRPYSTGSPLGIAIDSRGTIYYADLGLVFDESGIGPGPRTGSIRRIRFDGDQPRPPETLFSPGSFPDGVGVFMP
jgi:sugar lactone lactonase YvrE